MNEENYLMQVQDLPESELIKSFRLKNRKTIVFFLALGIALFFTRNIGLMVLGALFTLVAVLNLFMIKDRKVLDIRKDGLVIYANQDPTLCYYVPFDSVEVYNMENADMRFYFRVTTVTGEGIDCASGDFAILSTLRKIIPEKEKFTKWKNDFNKRNEKRRNH